MMADQVAAANAHVQRKSDVFFLLEIKTDEASLVEKWVNHRLNATLAEEEKKKNHWPAGYDLSQWTQGLNANRTAFPP